MGVCVKWMVKYVYFFATTKKNDEHYFGLAISPPSNKWWQKIIYSNSL